MKYYILIYLAIVLSACESAQMKSNLDIQGHRGCRGLYPENTINGFVKAFDIGVNTLEMDVVISKDKQVIISHEPFFNHEISIQPNGIEISEDTEKSFNIYEMNIEEIQQFDVGTKIHPRFPRQKKVVERKPLLADMFEQLELHSNTLRRSINYNIEIKRRPDYDLIFHPDGEEFVDLVMQTVLSSGCADRTSIQCFDHEILRILNKKYPNQQTVLLVDDISPPSEHLKKIGFVPTIYSPHYKMVNDQLIRFCEEKGMKLIPWTVNNPEDVQNLITSGVDGIISDYPDMVVEIWESLQPAK